MESDLEILKMLLDRHTEETVNRRKKIRSTTEKYITLVFVIFAWLCLQKDILSISTKILFSIMVLLIMIVAMRMIYHDNKVHLEHAKVVKKISKKLGFFEKGRFIDSESLYPKSWMNFGDENKSKGVFSYYIFIILLTFAIIFMTYLI